MLTWKKTKQTGTRIPEQPEDLHPHKVEARALRSGTDWAAGEVEGWEVRRPCQADGWEYSEFTPGYPCTHKHTHRDSQT